MKISKKRLLFVLNHEFYDCCFNFIDYDKDSISIVLKNIKYISSSCLGFNNEFYKELEKIIFKVFEIKAVIQYNNTRTVFSLWKNDKEGYFNYE